MFNKILTMIFAVCMLLVNVCFAATDSDYVTVTARGYGSNESSALEAAQVMGRQALLAEIKGVQITSDMTVEDGIMISAIVRQHVDGLIKGAETVTIKDIAPREKNGITYVGSEVVMRIPMFGTNSVAEAVLPNIPAVEPTNDMTTDLTIPTTGIYTGVLIDCSDVNISTAMCPAIKTPDGRVVYGRGKFDNKWLINNGLVSYEKANGPISKRCGDNPIRIKAIDVDNFCNPVISIEDAQMLLAENNRTHFLDETKVVIHRAGNAGV